MKKSIIALLVLVSAFVCQAASVEEIYEYYNGVFTITQDGDLMLTYNSSDTKYGQVITEFGYVKLAENETDIIEFNPLTNKITGGSEPATLSGLQANDKIALYIKTRKGGDTVYFSTDVTFPNSERNFHETDYGYTFGDKHWEDGRVLGFTVTSTPSAPSGQPLPGALTTMLIAGGCAAYLKRKKSARK